MKRNCWEMIQKFVMDLPIYIMAVFTMVHLGIFISFDIGGKTVSLSFANQLTSLLYLAVIYFWALFVNRKGYIKATALIMGTLSFCGLVISLSDFGSSFNDLLFAGTAVMTVFYVFDNAQYLLRRVKELDKYLTAAIWSFVAFSVIMFVFFPNRQTQWGNGVYFYGHRYASVCSLIIMLIALKLTNRPKHCAVYWVLLLGFYYIIFWTGARVYMLSNLGQIYALLYVFRKSNKDFLMKCVAVTLAVILAFFTSSSWKKFTNIIDGASERIEQAEESDQNKQWVDSLSNGRLTIWKNCLDSYMELPVLNKILGSGNKYVYDHCVLPGGAKIYAHSDFINILHFNGLLGLLMYLVVFIGFVAAYWKRNGLPMILLIGFWGVWFVLAALNGFGNYSADMMSLPYLSVLALWVKNQKRTATEL